MTDGWIRQLPWSLAPADQQIAWSGALLDGLEHADEPALRWYGMAPDALLLGSSQRPSEIDPAACAAAGVSAHRRLSGGGVVHSGDLLSLDLALPRGHPLFREDVTDSYRWLGEVWARALQGLGVAARVLPIGEARADTQALDPLLKKVCFGGLSPYEVMVGQRKLVGLAQIRRRAGALFQCGVYLRWAPWRTAALLAAPAEQRVDLAERLAARVAGLDSLGGAAPGQTALIDALAAPLADLAGLRLRPDTWSQDEQRLCAARGAAQPAAGPAG
jgi:lipoate-protein ligase A